MGLLLYECLPQDLAVQLPGHNVKTVPQVGWASIGNGRLLRLIADSDEFDVFLTVDKQLPRQNQTRTLPFAIVVLRAKSNRMLHILPVAREILRRIAELQPGHVYELTQPD